MNSWDKCKNCGGDYALHNYETDQCPRNGVEAPLNRKQEWMTTTFELVDTRDAQIATLRAESAGRLDALNSWAALWAHICMAAGCADYLPSEANFDAMIDKQITAIRQAREQLNTNHPMLAYITLSNAIPAAHPAQAEQLRAFESAEHCPDCGGFMALAADAPEDAPPFCPFCLCEKQAEQLRAARSSFNAISTIPPHFTDAAAISEAMLISRAWLSAQPAPSETKCKKCDGCGKIANTDDQEPWTVWLGLPLHSATAVLAGLVRPIKCPECGGTGKAVKFTGESSWDAIVNSHSLDIEEEESFRIFVESKGYTQDAPVGVLEHLYQQWKISRVFGQ